jgi:hypothetical protein
MPAKPHNGKPKVHVVAVRRDFENLPELSAFMKEQSPNYIHQNGEHTFFLLPENAVGSDNQYGSGKPLDHQEVKKMITPLQHVLASNQHIVFSLFEGCGNPNVSQNGYVVSKDGYSVLSKRAFTGSEDVPLTNASYDDIPPIWFNKYITAKRHYLNRARFLKRRSRGFPSIELPEFGRVGTRICRDIEESSPRSESLVLVPADTLSRAKVPQSMLSSPVIINDRLNGVKVNNGTSRQIADWHNAHRPDMLPGVNKELEKYGVKLHLEM